MPLATKRIFLPIGYDEAASAEPDKKGNVSFTLPLSMSWEPESAGPQPKEC